MKSHGILYPFLGTSIEKVDIQYRAKVECRGQWRSQEFLMGSRERAAGGWWSDGSSFRRQVGLGAELDFCNFSIKTTHFLCYFSQNS